MIASPEQVERRLIMLRLLDDEAANEVETEWPRALGLWDAPADHILPDLPFPVAGWTAGQLRGALLDELNDRIASALAEAELAEAIAAARQRKDAA